MKKYIFSVLMAAMAAFTFSSCEDVPEPYTLPTQPGAPTTPEVATQGTEASPYTVTDAKTVKTGTSKYIKGYIVGYVPDKALNEAIFGDATSAEKAPTNILLAAKADEKEVNNCMPIQLPSGDLRTALNLKDNPGNLKKELLICGSIENYFGAIGLKTPVYAKVDGKEIGNKPGSTTTPDTPTTGKGSASDPYNVAEAIAVIKAGKAPTTEVYLTGIISDVAFYNDQYKSITYYISDDGKSKDMQVYSGKGLNGKDFASKEELKVGQKVTILGKIMKYTDKNGNEIMEVDKTSSIIKIEEGGSTETPDTPKPDTPATGEGLTIDGTTVTLSNAAATTAGASVELDLNAAGLVDKTTVETVKFSDGSTVTFDANGQKNGPTFYNSTKGVRVYANNKLIFKGIKKIKQIVMTCDSYKGTDYVGNATATIEFSDKTATYTNLYTEPTGGGVQLRVKTIKIVYAE